MVKAWAEPLPIPIIDHIRDCEKVLGNLEDAHLTLFGENLAFGQEEILVVRHLCEPYGRRPSPTKIDVIQAMKEVCNSQFQVWRFLRACTFYHICIPQYAHIADPLYQLSRKGKKFEWRTEHIKALKKLKKALRRAEALKKSDCDRRS